MPPSAASPGPHPDPPNDLQHQSLPITTIDAGTTWVRIYPLAFAPEFFDRSDRHRFNAPAGQFGTLYAGADDYCAFAETFLRDLDLRIVSLADLAARGRSHVETLATLRLVDLTGPGLAQVRADGRLTTGNYVVAQCWSLAFHEHPDQPDGLLWRSRFDPSRACIAIYERAQPSIQTTPIGPLLDPGFSATLAAILDHYGFGLM